MKKKLVVIGGGAAGMMAAICAAEEGGNVTLLEPNERLGKKLNITGKGRCNVTNDSNIDTLLANIPQNSRFLYSAFSNFNAQDTVNFFENLGVPLKVERGRRVFPVSDRAFDISGALERKLKALKVIWVQERGLSIQTNENTVVGVKGENNFYAADSVILATGGLSYPATGSTGDGYRIARELGHTIIPLRGSLVPLEEKGNLCVRMQGLNLKNTHMTVWEGEKKVYSDFGELLFTHFGLSGPLALSASAHMRHFDRSNTNKKKKIDYRVELDFKPALDEQTLDRRLLSDFAKYTNSDFANALFDLLPRKSIPVIVEVCGIPPHQKVHDLTKKQRQSLLYTLKHFMIQIAGLRPIEEAIITSGGVNVREVNPKTMESKLIHGLYFAGEILDVDAYTGGFNLQTAWSTGHMAGLSSVK